MSQAPMLIDGVVARWGAALGAGNFVAIGCFLLNKGITYRRDEGRGFALGWSYRLLR